MLGHRTANPKALGAICPRIKMIHKQNETFIIWLPHKVLHGFLCQLQHVEGHDVEKTISAL